MFGLKTADLSHQDLRVQSQGRSALSSKIEIAIEDSW
jgi:hypothetical protein